MNNNKNLLFENSHLTDVAAARLAGAMTDGDFRSLPETIFTHVELCPQCKSKILDIALFLRTPQVELPGKLPAQAKPFQIPWAWIIGILSVVLLGGAVYFFLVRHDARLHQMLFHSQSTAQLDQKKNTDKKELTFPTPKTITKPSPQKSIILPFDASVQLEKLAADMAAKKIIQVVSPLEDAAITGKILFQWQVVLKKPETLRILDNKGKSIYSYTLIVSFLEISVELNPGRYYWKLEDTQGAALFVGKFIIPEKAAAVPVTTQQ